MLILFFFSGISISNFCYKGYSGYTCPTGYKKIASMEDIRSNTSVTDANILILYNGFVLDDFSFLKSLSISSYSDKDHFTISTRLKEFNSVKFSNIEIIFKDNINSAIFSSATLSHVSFNPSQFLISSSDDLTLDFYTLSYLPKINTGTIKIIDDGHKFEGFRDISIKYAQFSINVPQVIYKSPKQMIIEFLDRGTIRFHVDTSFLSSTYGITTTFTKDVQVYCAEKGSNSYINLKCIISKGATMYYNGYTYETQVNSQNYGTLIIENSNLFKNVFIFQDKSKIILKNSSIEYLDINGTITIDSDIDQTKLFRIYAHGNSYLHSLRPINIIPQLIHTGKFKVDGDNITINGFSPLTYESNIYLNIPLVSDELELEFKFGDPINFTFKEIDLRKLQLDISGNDKTTIEQFNEITKNGIKIFKGKILNDNINLMLNVENNYLPYQTSAILNSYRLKYEKIITDNSLGFKFIGNPYYTYPIICYQNDTKICQYRITNNNQKWTDFITNDTITAIILFKETTEIIVKDVNPNINIMINGSKHLANLNFQQNQIQRLELVETSIQRIDKIKIQIDKLMVLNNSQIFGNFLVENGKSLVVDSTTLSYVDNTEIRSSFQLVEYLIDSSYSTLNIDDNDFVVVTNNDIGTIKNHKITRFINMGYLRINMETNKFTDKITIINDELIDSSVELIGNNQCNVEFEGKHTFITNTQSISFGITSNCFITFKSLRYFTYIKIPKIHIKQNENVNIGFGLDVLSIGEVVLDKLQIDGKGFIDIPINMRINSISFTGNDQILINGIGNAIINYNGDKDVTLSSLNNGITQINIVINKITSYKPIKINGKHSDESYIDLFVLINEKLEEGKKFILVSTNKNQQFNNIVIKSKNSVRIMKTEAGIEIIGRKDEESSATEQETSETQSESSKTEEEHSESEEESSGSEEEGGGGDKDKKWVIIGVVVGIAVVAVIVLLVILLVKKKNEDDAIQSLMAAVNVNDNYTNEKAL